MGCDIHIWVEYQQHRKASWVAETCWGFTQQDLDPGDLHYGKMFLDDRSPWRCYDMFGHMALVRTCPTNGYPPRGYPADMSPEVSTIANVCINEWGFHTPSWLTLTEYKRCYKKASMRSQLRGGDYILEQIEQRIDQMQFDNSLLGIKDKPKARLVFCFDS